jgi:drug/metabolite transporter (DMT)-like permease
MLYILLSICCSVAVYVLLKLAKRYHIDVLQAITWNYSVAIFLIWLIFKPQLHFEQSIHTNIYLVIGIVLPLFFLTLSASITITGIVRTAIAQRLSLLVPVLVAFLLFSEKPTLFKSAAIVIGLIAIVCSIMWKRGKSKQRSGVGFWLYPLLVFIGFGVINILFTQVTQFTDVPYTTSIFVIYTFAFIISFVFLIIQIYRKKTRFSWPHILIGWVLGMANFGSILFYMKAHKALTATYSTAAMNVGVVIFAALTGIIFFKEKLSNLNKVGIALALIAIIIITNF